MALMGNAPERRLPYDIDLEQAILGSFLVDQHALELVSNELRPGHFYDPLHQRLFDCMLYLMAKGTAVTPLTVKATLASDTDLAQVGGYPYLVSLARAAPAMPSIRDYAQILRDLETRRCYVRIGEDLVNASFDLSMDAPVATLGRQACDAIFEAARTSDVRKPESMHDVAETALREHEAALTGKVIPKMPTGFAKLNDEIGGLRGSDLITVAGRSGAGKSALLGGMAVRVALAGFPVLVFSLEMDTQQWVERTLCDLDFDTAVKPMHYRKFRNGIATGDDIERAARASQRIHGLPIEIIDDDQLSMEDITALARAFAMDKGKLGLVVIDYLQIVQPNDKRGNRSREQDVTQVARGAKSLAKQLRWSVVAGCQLLNKGEGAKEERRPQASDIRESGSIEMESDIIIAPHRKAFFVEARRPDKHFADPEYIAWRSDLEVCEHDFELVGLKNRHGRRFSIPMWCEIGSSAIRDELPIRGSQAEIDARGLLV